MTRTGLSIGLLLASTLAALAAPELLFKHNENGGVVEGSQTKLMEAIRSGRSVKVVYTRSNVSWQRLCLHASVTSASGNEVVSCVITAIPDTIDAPSMKGRILGTPTAFETAIFNSSGLRHTHKLDAKGNLLGEETSPACHWLVRRLKSIFIGRRHSPLMPAATGKATGSGP